MCRLLLARSERPFDPAPHLRALALVSQRSREYQGHGWGCAWLEDGAWRLHHCITPIWEDTLPALPATGALIAHARSAFRDEGITIENNMPFSDGRFVFAFNGELRGVRIKEEGRIGAEKIFNYIRRFDRGAMLDALARGTDIILRRSRYVRAMNIVMASTGESLVSSHFGEDPDYFQLHAARAGDVAVVCSQPYPADAAPELANLRWRPVDNGTAATLDTLVTA